ncbi:TonB-dependent siderophore receptor [Pseudomonas tremae]|uniref:TonB-dependent receptor n=1 Tax=Pseudomonas coronafaciens pv. porri TaxID=83964 RepID=A0ABR5JS64_9PSED|nr:MULTISPECIES: TonB-dependent siderophore receptor [Pseudomonas syringae group]KOP55243.1 TonB-dependent receptor [Pseudomonas coronafaciens pv. porri]KOP60227.1 TonB-dependent receptor [Pseudomonas coronafaciens pv. porri]KPY23813.1 TonB-dependent siderophore receptor [Pseudomonas coronafaciens pv. porri]MCQ3025758.1 TonB-dependent siderophore receptor [Pseudomonas tremae]RMV96013.1 TonB-dependent siderophore receptor [Pseudomonas coronafaciens pv. porri]
MSASNRPAVRYAWHLLPLGMAVASPLLAAEPISLEAVNVNGFSEQDSTSDYRAGRASVGGFEQASLLDTPASVSVFTEALIKDRQAKLLSDVLRNDASVGDGYAPVGYYENFVVRGFSLNAANSYRINGRSIAGEQNVALENKQQVELLKGLSGLQSGVSEPGGVINYQTKRAQDVRSVTVSTNEHGERYFATDVGGWFGSEQQFGLRVNLAHEDIRSYVQHADGQRDFASLAFDWNISERALLQLDVEYQNKEQRSVPGYQLLGGTTLPHDASPRKLLGYQNWSSPVGMESLNMNGRFEYQFNDSWKGSLSASRSRVVIDDYSAFAWGCYGSASCAAEAVPNHFSAEGGYDIYDFRSPDDTRRNDEIEAAMSGVFSTGSLAHQLTFGSSAYRRTVDTRGTFNELVGSGNINQSSVPVEPSGLPLPHTERRLDSRQYGLFVIDRISFDEHWQTVLGGRQVRLDEQAFAEDGSEARHTERYVFLPQTALIYKPVDNVSLYTSYSKGLSLGGTAAWFTTNASEILAPTVSRQIEAGIKYDWQRMSLTAALFQARQAYQYSRPNDDGTFTYVQQGEQKNTGLELGASGWLTERLQISASAAAIRSRVDSSGTDAYEGHQTLNVPEYRGTLQADYSLPIRGLALLGGVQYSASKYADREGSVQVSDYALFNIGSRYSTKVSGYDTVLRLTVDNLFDKRYWRDAGEYLGDDYLFMGAPRTARLSASINF